MRSLESSKGAAGLAVRIAVVVAAVGMIGASPTDWPRVAKADRVSSPADCRDADAAATIDCLGIVLPITDSEVFEVAPGLTIVGQIPG